MKDIKREIAKEMPKTIITLSKVMPKLKYISLLVKSSPKEIKIEFHEG